MERDIANCTAAAGLKDEGNAHFKASRTATSPAKEAKLRKAVECYTNAVRRDTRLTAAYGNRAQCHIDLGAFGEAVRDCVSVLALEPGNVKAYIRRGVAREGLGQELDALEDYREAQIIEPKNKAAADALERISASLCENPARS